MRPSGAFLSHVDPFVEALGDAHRAGSGKAIVAARFLLQGRGDERRNGIALFLFFSTADDAIGGFFQFVDDSCRRFASLEMSEDSLPARFFFQPLSIDGVEMRGERALSFFASRWRAIFQYSTGMNASISFSRSTTSLRATDWTLPAERPPSLAPFDSASEDGGNFIADDPVEKAARLLGIDERLSISRGCFKRL